MDDSVSCVEDGDDGGPDGFVPGDGGQVVPS